VAVADLLEHQAAGHLRSAARVALDLRPLAEQQELSPAAAVGLLTPGHLPAQAAQAKSS
jgi:hypothetical protein